MTAQFERRAFLRTSAATAAAMGAGGVAALGQFPAAFGAQPKPATVKLQYDAETDLLARRIRDTSRDRVIPMMVEQLRNGLSHRRFMAALLRTAMRYHHRGHQILVANSVHQICLDLPREDALLPLFWHLDNIKKSYRSNRDKPGVDLLKGRLPAPEKAIETLDMAISNVDDENAQLAVIAIARSRGPKAAFQHLWRHGSNQSSIGHTIICLSNLYRSLQALGWRDAEQALALCAARCCRKPTQLDDANAERANRAIVSAKLPADWAGGRRDHGAVLELIEMFREGNAAEACAATQQQLLTGKFNAASVWEAIFLTTNEVSARFKWGGLCTTGRPRHSITGTNALHFAFRTHFDPEVRLFILLQAVGMTCSFVAIPQAKGVLNDFKINEIAESESPKSVEDVVDEVFHLIPPRRSQHQYRDRSGQDAAMKLVYAMAQKHSDQRFLTTARRLLSQKCTIDPHDLKFPMAAFENYHYISPKWRPNYLAASVFYLHGAQMEDNIAVQEARELLDSL